MNAEFVERLLKLSVQYEFQSSLLWDEDLNFSINCNDWFVWGCADYEDITPETIDLLERSIQADPDTGDMLYCCRLRGMRPQGAAYSMIKKEVWPLFDDCGPERPVEFGNPYAPGEYNRGKSS